MLSGLVPALSLELLPRQALHGLLGLLAVALWVCWGKRQQQPLHSARAGHHRIHRMQRDGRMRLPAGRMAFRPQLFWQEVLPEHVVGTSLEIRMGVGELSDGKNYARLKAPADGGQAVAADGGYAAAQARLVEASPHGDEDVVSEAVSASATWGDAKRMSLLLGSCYVTEAAGTAALSEASANGHQEVVALLLKAGAKAGSLAYHGKTALHRACENGHEAIATMLLKHMAARPENGGREAVWQRDSQHSLTAWELASQLEMGGVARRLRTLAEGPSDSAALDGKAAAATPRTMTTPNGHGRRSS